MARWRQTSSACDRRRRKRCTCAWILSCLALKPCMTKPSFLMVIASRLTFSSLSESERSPPDAFSKRARLLRWSSGMLIWISMLANSRKLISPSPELSSSRKAPWMVWYFLTRRSLTSAQKATCRSASFMASFALNFSFHSRPFRRSSALSDSAAKSLFPLLLLPPRFLPPTPLRLPGLIGPRDEAVPGLGGSVCVGIAGGSSSCGASSSGPGESGSAASASAGASPASPSPGSPSPSAPSSAPASPGPVLETCREGT
mmetsp:Transcript_22179/g.66137  ORF Transcript_22179/g.66137 Transcript_22179/m.66137 type:complete len:258 (+) Transcript_22179:1781-2554(+)